LRRTLLRSVILFNTFVWLGFSGLLEVLFV